jgi:putative transposase
MNLWRTALITFSAGLVIRIGDRTLQFERDLGDSGQLQFKYLDNYEIVTYGWGKLYGRILSGEIIVVHQNGNKVHIPTDESGKPKLQLPIVLTDHEVDDIEFRLGYVHHCIRARVAPGSVAQIRTALQSMQPREDERAHPSAWAVRSWLKKFKRSGGNKYELRDKRALAPHHKRLLSTQEQMIDQGIARHYLQLNGVSAAETARRIKTEIDAKNRLEGSAIAAPSKSSVERRIKAIDPFVRDYKRLGPGYARNKWRYSLSGNTCTRVLERVEIDHTWLDLWVLDPKTGVPIGRPWITVLIDRFSGYILGFHVSFYGPSVGSVAAAMRNAILPKDELLKAVPGQSLAWSAMGSGELYVVDNGLEFHSRAFLRLVWHLRADLIFNPVRQPWLKPAIERCMMEVCRVLPGRGKVYAPRKNMQPQDPREGAAILFDDLCVGLLTWAADVFPKQIHPKTLVRPLDLWEEGRLASPLPMFPLTLDNFDIIGGVGTQRTITGDGAFFHYLRYNSPDLQDYRRAHHESFRTEIRFNPDDLAFVHVLLPNAKSWLAVPLQRPTQAYGQGLSLIQHEIIRAEAGKKLTKANAEYELEQAQLRLNDFWGEAISRGVKVRRDGDLVRLQGLTSAKVFSERGESKTRTRTPEASASSDEHVAAAMPFPAYTLEEEFA